MPKLLTTICCGFCLASGSLAQNKVPNDLESSIFSGPDITPSPACLCVAPSGEVFVAVDMNGSLGKGPGKGSIIRLIDKDSDGAADSHSIYAKVDGIRGLVSLGTKLYVLHTTYDQDSGEGSGMNLTLFVDENWDGVADHSGTTLIKGISSTESIRSRGTDHSTNGIRMGIDGWIYIAVGDYGFSEATGADGTKLTLLGGGIVRVRPDGSEMELYTKGLRNIYDVAIDPFLNVYTRGNTNDGGGWNIRFIHQIQSANYGYPSLFMNFAAEILPALEDVGGGSGTGALFLNEPSWPAVYNNQPMMADWGRNAVYIHRLEEDGPTFTQNVEDFIHLSQVTDLDVDASGRMYLSAWDGASFRGSSKKGYVIRVTPKDWKYRTFSPISNEKTDAIIKSLASPSGTIRLAAQQELLTRNHKKVSHKVLRRVALDEDLPLESRIAGLFTYAQMAGPEGISELLKLTNDADLAEFAIRAATDRLEWVREADLSVEPIASFLKEGTARQKAAAAIALGRIGKTEAAKALLEIPYTFPNENTNTLPIGEPVLTRATRTAPFAADIVGYTELHLHSLQYSVGKENDRTHWMNPTIHLKNGEKLRLLDLDWKSANTENGPIRKVYDLSGINRNLDKKRADRNNKESLEVPLVSTVVFELPDDAIRFTAVVTAAISETGEQPRVEFHATPHPITGLSKRNEHATPDAKRVLPHLAVQSLVRIQAEDMLIRALGTGASDLAHWAIRYQHSEKLVEGVLQHLRTTENPAERRKTLTTLARLYQKEAPYDGSWWWTTRPDTRGPYYKPITWSASPRIQEALEREWDRTSTAEQNFLTRLSDSHRLRIEKFGTFIVEQEEPRTNVDLSKIASKKGAIASMPIEDVLLSLEKVKGKIGRGEKLFAQQGCVACHTTDSSKPAIGPFMGQIGSIMQPHQIAEAILRPNATISQGFQTSVISTSDGASHIGFVTGRNADEITIRDMAGQVTKIDVSKVKNEDHLPASMMPPGLANSLSIEDFASLVAFLSSQK